MRRGTKKKERIGIINNPHKVVPYSIVRREMCSKNLKMSFSFFKSFKSFSKRESRYEKQRERDRQIKERELRM